MNEKLYCKWEEKTSKKFILYQELDKKKSGSKNRKEESSNDFLDNDDAHNDLDNSNVCIFTKKELKYLYAHLNKKN